MSKELRRDERGVALIMTVLLAMMVTGMAVGVIIMSSNANLITKFHATEAMMEGAADAGLELARDTLNGTPAILPNGPGAFDTLEFNAVVRDAYGNVIPGFTRSVYAGTSGDSTGQFGVFASAISVISNARGAVVVRRIQLKQDPFSRFARFFNTWTCCMWGAQEVIFGPLHSNQGMRVQSSGSPGATFWGPVSVVASSVTGSSNGNWNGGLTTSAPPIPFPTTTTLTAMQVYATTGNTNFTGDATLNAVDPDTRIEFFPLDLNNDGDVTDGNEGFFRIYKALQIGSSNIQQRNRAYANGRRWVYPGGFSWPSGTSTGTDPNLVSRNCGGTFDLDGAGANPADWYRADTLFTLVSGGTAGRDAVRAALASPGRRCFLGGDHRLNPDSLMTIAEPGFGLWIPWAGWGGTPNATIQTALETEGLAVSANSALIAETFIPLSRSMNANFKGVIYVTGSVAVSGTLRGRVTIVATGQVMIDDDITYVTPPNTTCADILGLLTPDDATVAYNNLTTPFDVDNNWTVQFDESPDESIHGFMLTLGAFTGENIGVGGESVMSPEDCGGTSRGCKKMIGGSIQQGIAGTYSGSTGWAEQDTYDHCGVDQPPPYYPTTGRFTKNRYYEIDPVGFNVATWFANNQP